MKFSNNHGIVVVQIKLSKELQVKPFAYSTLFCSWLPLRALTTHMDQEEARPAHVALDRDLSVCLSSYLSLYYFQQCL